MLQAFYRKFGDYLPMRQDTKHIYVNAARVNDHYKNIVRGANQITLINDLKLDYIVTRSRSNKKKNQEAGEILNGIDINIDGQFNPQTMKLSVRLDQLTDLKRLEQLRESPKTIEKLHKLMGRINVSRDINNLDLPISVDIQDVSEQELTPSEFIPMEILILEEHEQFHDVDGNVVLIEVRGERSKNTILFKAKDVAEYFDIPSLTKNLLDDRTAYKYVVDYVILTFNHKLPLNIYDQLNNSSDTLTNEEGRYYRDLPISDGEHKKIPINHDHLYLTLAGYIRTASISRSGNANLSKVFDWLCDVVYTHQFGSDDERMEMAQDLLKTVLNDKLSGLYCIDLGTIDELAGRMSITEEELQAVNSSYSIEKCGSYHVRKFGLSKDISTRLTQHKNKKDGYGRWSLNVSLKWMILLSESQLHKAESLLSTLFTADGYSFVHTDEHGKRHDELILFAPKDETKIRSIYKQVLGLFPSKENELCKIIEENQCRFESQILKMELKSTNIQHELKIQLNNAEHKAELFQKDNEMLQLKLELANFKLATK